MLLRLLILMTVVPLTELVILLRIAERLHWGPTIALVIVTGVLGAWLARREGLRAWGQIQSDLAAGTMPAHALVDGLLILVAGVVLITPGILTDLCGFALLVRPIRVRVGRRLTEAFRGRMVIMHHGDSTQFVDVAATGRDVDDPGHGDP